MGHVPEGRRSEILNANALEVRIISLMDDSPVEDGTKSRPFNFFLQRRFIPETMVRLLREAKKSVYLLKKSEWPARREAPAR